MLLGSFFPLAMLILAVLGSHRVRPGHADRGGGHGLVGRLDLWRLPVPTRQGSTMSRCRHARARWHLKESTSPPRPAPWCAGCSSARRIFSAAFALLGGQEIINQWVLSLDMTPVQFMILAQFIIFLLGWPLEWTEIIVIFMPIFIPLLPHFGIDPLFFGLLVALNLQTAFLSPPVAMAAFYLKGVSPPHVTLNQIFAGMMPFMGIQVLALSCCTSFRRIGLWLPGLLYK